MSDSYRIVLTGNPLPGRDLQDVARRLAALMRLSETKAAGLMSGEKTTVKRGLTEEQVRRYVAALEKAGAEVRAELESTPVSKPAPEPVAVAPSPLSLVEKTVKCPACGVEQPEQTFCSACGVDMTRTHPGQEEGRRQPAQPASSATVTANGGARDDARPTDFETPAPISLSFDGRIGRLRYLAYALAGYAPVIVAAILGGILGALSGTAVFMLIFMIAGGVVTFVLMLRIMVLRLHDINRSGWTLLAIFVVSLVVAALFSRSAHTILTIGNILLTLVFTLWPGDSDTNDYGPPAGPNTVWTTVGAVAVIVLGLLGLIGHNFFGRNHGAMPSASANQAEYGKSLPG